MTLSHLLSFRFLKKVEDGTWEDVGDEVAREKTSQVLRDAINSVKTFSNMPDPDSDIATPEVTTRAPSREVPNAVTHDKTTPLKRPATLESRRERATPSIQPWISDNARSPAMSYTPYRGPGTQPPLGDYAGMMPYQYHITPSMSITQPPSAARVKRARYHESPLVAGYHRAPGFFGSDPSAYGTPNVSHLYGSPPNPRKQGFSYTPPSMAHSMPSMPGYPTQAAATATPVASGQAAAGQPSGESTDCWINDVPPFQSHQKPPPARQPHQRQSSLGAADFDPFNDDLLSDSEHRDGSPLLFP
jgi:hypothetical protein